MGLTFGDIESLSLNWTKTEEPVYGFFHMKVSDESLKSLTEDPRWFFARPIESNWPRHSWPRLFGCVFVWFGVAVYRPDAVIPAQLKPYMHDETIIQRSRDIWRRDESNG